MNPPPPVQFDDGKAPDALRTIGEVARALGVRQHVLRYWEEQFPMLRPLKRSGGRRYYRSTDIALVQTIDRLVHHEGYTLRGARLALDGADPKPAQATVPTGQGGPSQRSQLIAVRDELVAALERS